MLSLREFDPDRIPGPDIAPFDDDPHHAGLTDEVSVFVTPQQCFRQAFLKTVDLDARIAQTRNLDHCRVSQMKPRSSRQRKKVDPAGGDVLS
jgi:hypothetical protein